MADKKRILVVDDEEGARDMLSLNLESKGYEVETAADGETALRVFGEHIDIILLDVLMPGITGIEVLKKIRERDSRVVIIVMTAHASLENSVQALNADADYFIRKPIKMDEVLEVLETRCEGRVLSPCRKISDRAVSADVLKSDWVELTVSSRTEYVERLETFFTTLMGTFFTDIEKSNIKTAFGEILGNAIEWGNKEESEKKVKITYCMFPDGFTFKFEDQGSGFDYRRIRENWKKHPEQYIEDRIESGKRPGGYGIMLVADMMDELYYNDRGNIVIMTKYIDTKKQEEKT